jgi:AraC-like DNA-binding protein
LYTFTKKSLNELFSGENLPDYSVIVTEIREENGEIAQDDYLAEVLNASINLMTASLVAHYCERSGNLIICFLNYNASVFSIRSFVGSLRQTMYSLSQSKHSTVCYSEGLQDRKQLIDEFIFLTDSVRYGMLLGSYRPLTGRLLHSMECSDHMLPAGIAATIMKKLDDKNYDEVIELFREAEGRFIDMPGEEMVYSFSEMMNYISEVCVVMKLFFAKQNYHYPFMDENLLTSLYKSNGCAGVIRQICNCLLKYCANFRSVPVSERENRNMQEILKYIEDNLSTVSLSGTASHFGITDAYLCRLFKKNMEVNFTDYIKEKKLEAALLLLQGNEKKTVSAISQAVGIKSQSYFQNLFKSKYGITPEEYRRRYRINSEKYL